MRGMEREKEDGCLKPSQAEVKNDQTEQDKLFALFGEATQNPMILDIIDALEEGEVLVDNPKPEYFDGLCHVMELYPHLPGNVRKIDISILRSKKEKDNDFDEYADNIYDMPTVVALLIQRAQDELQSLALHNFRPNILVAIVSSSLHDQKRLQELNLEANDLTTNNLSFILQNLPSSSSSSAAAVIKPFFLKLNHNCLDDELKLGKYLSYQHSKLSCVQALRQSTEA